MALERTQATPPAGAQFELTQWSMILKAGQADPAAAAEALEKLCAKYWYPLYAFVRRQGYTEHDAQDLTQDFFAGLLRRGDFQRASPEKGKFRSFLLASVKNFMMNEWDRKNAQKRGGGMTIASLDEQTAEERYRLEPADQSATAETLYERQWATTLLDQAASRLRGEYEKTGKGDRFEHLKPFLAGEPDAASYREIAGKLGMGEGAVKSAVHRMRQRFGAILRAEIANTVANPLEVDQELKSLFAALAK